MEEIYMLAFKINMLQSDKQLCGNNENAKVNGFINIISEEDFALSLAEEMLSRDLLLICTQSHLYRQLALWQIIMICWAKILHSNFIILGTNMYPGDSYSESCPVEYAQLKATGDTAGADIDLELEDPIHLNSVLMCYLIIHVIDYFLYSITKNWDLWKVISPKQRKNLRESDKKNDEKRLPFAILSYLAIQLVKIAIMGGLFNSLLPYKFCEPFIGVALYQDLFFTIAVPIWVILE